MKSIGSTMTRIGGVMTATMTVPILGGFAAMIDSASNLNESTNAMNVVFGEAADKIGKFGENSAETVGLAESDWNQLAAVSGAAMKNYGFSVDQAADQTIKLGVRASDMASIFNTDVSDAMAAVQSMMRGETEPIRRYGVSINEVAVNAKAMQMGLVDATGAVTAEGKAQARLALFYEQTAQFAGDFANTSDQLANSSRILKAELKDEAAALGKELLPMALQAVQFFRELITKFQQLSPEVKKFALGFALFLAVLGPVVAGIGLFMTALPGLITFFTFIKVTAIPTMISFAIANWMWLIPLLIAVVLIGILVNSIIKEQEAVEKTTEAYTGQAAAIQNVAEATEAQDKTLKAVTKTAKGALAIFDDLNVLQSGTDNVDGMIGGVPDISANIPVIDTAMLDTAFAPFEDKITSIKEKASGIWDGVVNRWNGIWTTIQQLWWLAGWWFMTFVWEPIKTKGGEAWDWIKLKAGEVWTTIQQLWFLAGVWFGGLWDTIKTKFSEGWDVIKTKAGEVWETIKQIWFIAATWFMTNVGEPISSALAQAWTSIKEGAKLAWDRIMEVFGRITEWVQVNISDPVKNAFGSALDWVRGKWESVFSGIGDFTKGIINSLIDLLNGMLSGSVSGINGMIDIANNVGRMLPGWVDLASISAPQIPHLADGGIIKPNDPFAAVLGDNKTQNEIVAPEDMIRRIIREEMGGAGSEEIVIPVTLTLDGEVIYQNQQRTSRRHGKSLISGNNV